MKFAKNTVVALSMLLVSGSAFSFILAEAKSHKAKGCGTFKSPDGTQGSYQVEVEMIADCAKGEVTFNEHYTFGEHQKDISFRLVKTTNDFFAVYVDDQRVGGGYCFAEAKKNLKTCHLGVKYDENWAERTVHIDMDSKKVYRLGSFSHDGKVIAWHDHLGCKGKKNASAQDAIQE